MLPQVKKLSRRVGMEKEVPSGDGLGLNQKNRARARRLLYSLAVAGHTGIDSFLTPSSCEDWELGTASTITLRPPISCRWAWMPKGLKRLHMMLRTEYMQEMMQQWRVIKSTRVCDSFLRGWSLSATLINCRGATMSLGLVSLGRCSASFNCLEQF